MPDPDSMPVLLPGTVPFHGIPAGSGPLTAHDRLFFLHFPKTAGTTVHNCLCKLFDPADVCPERLGNIATLPLSYLERYRLFSAHAALKDFRFVPRPVRGLTFLRDPMDRSISLFQYWASFRDDFVEQHNLHLPRLAKTLDLETMYSDAQADQCGQFWNQYTRHLLGDSCLSPSGHPWRSQEEIVEAAIRNLDSMSFVGISENLSASFEALSRSLDIPNVYDHETNNVTRSNHLEFPDRFNEVPCPDISRAAYDNVRRANRLDVIVYRHAVEKFFGAPVVHRRIACFHTSQPPFASRTDARERKWVRRDGGGVLVFGPYLRLLPGRYVAKFAFVCFGEAETPGWADVVAEKGQMTLGRADLQPHRQASPEGGAEIEFSLASPQVDVEFRVFGTPGAELEVCTVVMVSQYLEE